MLGNHGTGTIGWTVNHGEGKENSRGTTTEKRELGYGQLLSGEFLDVKFLDSFRELEKRVYKER